MPMQVIAGNIDDDVADALWEVALHAGRSVDALVEDAIRQALPGWSMQHAKHDYAEHGACPEFS
jgi:hypothetical protein